MAALSGGDRDAIERAVQRRLPRDTGEGFTSLSVADLRAAIDAVDDWADSNAASFNTAIPQPARGVLSAKQKSWLLLYVVARRAEVA